MSRSRKKHAGFSQHTSQFYKNYSNRMIRRKLKQAKMLEDEGGWCNYDGLGREFWYEEQYMSYDIPNGMAYKQVMCSYDICDWKSVYHYGERDANWNRWGWIDELRHRLDPDYVPYHIPFYRALMK